MLWTSFIIFFAFAWRLWLVCLMKNFVQLLQFCRCQRGVFLEVFIVSCIWFLSVQDIFNSALKNFWNYWVIKLSRLSRNCCMYCMKNNKWFWNVFSNEIVFCFCKEVCMYFFIFISLYQNKTVVLVRLLIRDDMSFYIIANALFKIMHAKKKLYNTCYQSN